MVMMSQKFYKDRRRRWHGGEIGFYFDIEGLYLCDLRPSGAKALVGREHQQLDTALSDLSGQVDAI